MSTAEIRERMIRHHEFVIARRERGIDQSPTIEERERRMARLDYFIEQANFERAAIDDRLLRQQRHPDIQEARKLAKRKPHRAARDANRSGPSGRRW